MTDTLDQTFAETEASITPGTLCWVQTGMNVPGASLRNRRMLAVYAQGVGPQRWLLLVAATDKVRDITSEGWLFRTRLTEHEMNRLNLARFADSHRGWWTGEAEFVETATDYWCMEHGCFHGSETCPMPGRLLPVFTPPLPTEVEREDSAMVAALKGELAAARAANEVLVREHEAFIVRASEILGEEADAHDLCDTYDRIAERAGLNRRVRDHEVLIEVTYRQRIRVEARSTSAAEDMVSDAELISGWHPDMVLDLDIEDSHTPTDVTVKVIVEPPF